MLGLLMILLCLFALTFHELGHVWAMRTVGVPVRTISLLGFQIFGLPYFSKTYQPKWQKDPVTIEMHPFVIGAYVIPDQDAMKTLSVRDTAFVYGAGPFASFVYGIVMIAISMIITNPELSLSYLGIAFGMLSMMIFFRRFFCQYVVVLLGTTVLALLLKQLFIHPSEVASTMGGPVMIASTASGVYKQAEVTNHVFDAMFFIPGVISIAIGLTNAMPFVPLDGGRIVHAHLEKVHKRAGDIYATTGFFLFALLLVSAISGDMNLLVNGAVSLFK